VAAAPLGVKRSIGRFDELLRARAHEETLIQGCRALLGARSTATAPLQEEVRAFGTRQTDDEALAGEVHPQKQG